MGLIIKVDLMFKCHLSIVLAFRYLVRELDQAITYMLSEHLSGAVRNSPITHERKH